MGLSELAGTLLNMNAVFEGAAEHMLGGSFMPKWRELCGHRRSRSGAARSGSEETILS